MTTRHAVLGMGGVGGLIAGALARAGHDVTAAVRPASLAGYPALVSVDSPQGSFSAPVRPVAALDGALDVLWIAVKATQLDEALAAVRDGGAIEAVVPLLNGIDHVQLLRDRFGGERVIAATIAVESERVAPGRIVRRSDLALLSLSTRATPAVRGSVEGLAASGITTRYVEDETTLLWSKLVFLAPFALATSAAQAPLGEVRAQPAWRSRLEACVAEACAVASALGAQVDPGNVIDRLQHLPPAFRSSMQKDVAAGRPPELDAIAGPIVTGGQRLGIDVPATREQVALVRARAAGFR